MLQLFSLKAKIVVQLTFLYSNTITQQSKPTTLYLLFFKSKKDLTLNQTQNQSFHSPSPHPASNFQLKCNNNNILLAGYELLIHYLLLQMITQQRVSSKLI